MKRLLRFVFCTTILFVFCQKAVNAFQQIRYLGIEQGLSNNSVNTVFQDHFGFLWFGTYDGLNRYDGCNFKIFKNKWGDEKSLINNHVNCITEDAESKIWIGTEKGLGYYNYSDSKIYTVYYLPLNQKKAKKITSRINNLVTDASGNVYIATEDAGLLIYKKGAAICRQIAYLNNATNYNVHNLSIDKQGRLWLFISGVGLCQYNTAFNKINLINDELKAVSCITADVHHAFIWMGTERGLYKYDITHNKVINLSSNYALSSKNIMQLYLDKKEQVWVATDGGGINIIDPVKGKVSYILPGETEGSLSSGSVYFIYEDRDSRKWIATLKGGINIIDYKTNPFKLIRHDPLNKNSLVNNFTRSFCEDENRNIWIGTAGCGLSYWNTKLNTYTNYTHSEAIPGSLSSDFVMSIINDYQNKIWIATFNGGINLFNKNTHTFKHYTCFNTYTGVEDRNAWELFEDKHHNLWAATTRGGALYLFNNAADKFELFDYHLTSINCFYEDKMGALWAGNNSQLIKIDIKNRKHQYFAINAVVFAIHEDKAGRFWVGTDGGGLLLIDRAKQTYNRYTEINGLPSNTIHNILEDSAGFIWLSTYNGISKFNPRLKTFKNYYSSDGLQSNQFTYNAALKLKNGNLLFGGINGFNVFDPDSVKINAHEADLRITGLRINNESVEGNSTFTRNVPVVCLKNITIPYNQATIAIDYTTLEYSFPDKINYAYYLEGWDHSWNNVGKLKSAYYTRLNEGTYILRIKATNTVGVWSPRQQAILITVLPPWYRTWWAYCIYIGLLVALIYYYLLYRAKQTQLKHEIEIAHIKADKEKELNEKKLAFFTNISHEFRTPLTLIINPIKDMINNTKTNDDGDLNIVYRNARRLLSLVDQLLLFRKTESENDSLKIVKLNFAHLCREVYLCFIHQAKTKNVDFIFECTGEYIELYADREKIEIAFFNLISNALKFTPADGRVSITITEEDETIEVTVSDSGCGIPDSVGNRLFEKFYKAQNKTAVKTGFGIGLYLVKCFIEDHHGSISYSSELDNGTNFNIKLKKGKSHFGGSLIFEDVTDGSVYLEELIEDIPVKQNDGQNEIVSFDMMISDQQSMLIIDDNDEIMEYIKRIFKSKYKLYEAKNAEDGFRIIKESLPDIVISDIVMQDMSGIQLCKLVKEDLSLNHIPVILLTAELTPEIRLQGLDVGAYDCIGKPFEKDLLIARVSTILKNRSNLQKYFYNEITLQSNNLKISEEYKDFLNKCITVVENHLNNDDFNIKILASELGMSHSNLYKKIKSISGQSLNGFIRFIRLRKAAELLINTNCNVNEAAYRVGLNDIKYFREQFHKLFGMNPSEFIKKHRVAFHKNYLLNDQVISAK
jgi:ligand-binding sensor domain-containing protein/signal transduction histidine kinase/DNA-binding response OmpR family regulator